VRRLLLAIPVVAVVLLAAHFALHRPVEVELQLDYGAVAPSLREVDLVLTGTDEGVARELKLLYAAGAPTSDTRKTRLARGRYTAGARLVLEGRAPVLTSRTLDVDEPGRYTLDLSH
jgi:hypothetical protein